MYTNIDIWFFTDLLIVKLININKILMLANINVYEYKCKIFTHINIVI